MDDLDRDVVNGLGRRLGRLESRVELLQLVGWVALVLAVLLPTAAILVAYGS